MTRLRPFLTIPIAFLAVYCLLVLFLCTACTNNHSNGHSRLCNTIEQREDAGCDKLLGNPLELHTSSLSPFCDLPDCEDVTPPEPEPCDGKDHAHQGCK